MKLIKLDSASPRAELLDIIRNSELVNERVRFNENKGKPTVHIKDNGKMLRIKCEMVGGPTKDNGFLEGTYFVGSLKEKNGTSQLRGIILTAPIYHLFLALLFAFYIYRSAVDGVFNPVPIILLFFSILMFKGEFEKQGTIERYLKRAFKRSEANLHHNS